MCLRALDYLPPVQVTFGDFLRAVITADYASTRLTRHYRVALIQAFRSYGIAHTMSARVRPYPPLARRRTRNHTGRWESFVSKLSRKHANWNLPRDRAASSGTCWRRRSSSSRSAVRRRREATRGDGPEEAVGGPVVTRSGPEAASDLSSHWVIKLVQPPSDPKKPDGQHGRGVHSWWTRTPA